MRGRHCRRRILKPNVAIDLDWPQLNDPPQVAIGEANGLIHLPAMEKKASTSSNAKSKKLPGLFEHYRFGRSHDYVVGTPSGSGPMRAPPSSGPMGSTTTSSGAEMPQRSNKLRTAAAPINRFPKNN